MAYYLTIKDKDNYRTLDISSLPGFERKSNLKDSISYTLEEIDLCTSKYNSEYAFREGLYKYGIIRLEDITKNIEIRSRKKDSFIIVRNGIVYNSESKYLDEISLKYILLSKQTDLAFLEKLISYYRNSYCNKVNIGIIESMLSRQDFSSLYFVLENFYEREVYFFDAKSKDIRLKYKSFHDLAMFICRYDEKKELDKNGISIETYKEIRKESLYSLRETINCKNQKSSGQNFPSKVKKRTRKYLDEMHPIEGQISFFD